MGGHTQTAPYESATRRRHIRVRGTVQGVGFRPFVYRLARECGLAGTVRNTAAGVEIEVEGSAAALDAFAYRLRAEAPPLARVDGVETHAAPAIGEAAFRILPSGPPAALSLPVSPDAATCPECLEETLDPRSRRYRYPFTNCTNCGPRFTIIEALPYDRVRTTMRAFELCAACHTEYEDPGDRRFHAEPVACPACGPRLRLVFAEGEAGTPSAAEGDLALRGAAAALGSGLILALKGLGGFQLACDATSEAAVARLRERKAREAKPFAVMVADLEAARTLCHVSEAEAAALGGPRAPIVLLRRRGGAAVAASVAPGLATLGLMLPSTPLHHLLLREVRAPLVMTSGNRSEEPIAAEDGEALERLRGVADAFLLHGRAIAARYDDSVVRVGDGGETVLRRARGYAPEPLRLSRAAPVPVLGAGAQLKSSFCLVHGAHAFVSQHIGDLDDALTRAHYLETLGLYRRLFGVEPEVVAHDLHPDYASTRHARAIEGVRHVAVQHHHAHAASCLAEHGVAAPALAAVFDGAGLGTDGSVWGGELLLVDGARFRRLARLRRLPLPGGDAAAREPWRMALAALRDAFGDDAAPLARELLAPVPETRRRAVLALAKGGPHAPPASSAGRLFDAVAALAGVRFVNRFEGHAAMELEARAGADAGAPYPLPLVDGADGVAEWDTRPLVRAAVDDARAGRGAGVVADRFHEALARSVLQACERARSAEGVDLVVLSGGCFQNTVLTTRTRALLERAAFRVLTHRRVPANDGGISLGQAAVAVATLE